MIVPSWVRRPTLRFRWWWIVQREPRLTLNDDLVTNGRREVSLHVRFGSKAEILFNDLVGAGQHGRRNAQGERFGRLEIDHELELRRLENRHFCRFRSFQDLSNVLACLMVHPADTWAIAQECTDRRKLANKANDQQLVFIGE